VEKCGRTGQDTDDNIMWSMHNECRITNATDMHSEYAMIIAFPWQQWLRERASTSFTRTYIACLFTVQYVEDMSQFCCLTSSTVLSLLHDVSKTGSLDGNGKDES